MFTSDDGTVTAEHCMAQWSQTLIDAAETVSKTFRIHDFSPEYIENAGFVDVVEKKYKLPVGPWSSDQRMKELGQWNRLFCLQGLESWSLFLLSKVLKVRIPEATCSGDARLVRLLTMCSGNMLKYRHTLHK